MKSQKVMALLLSAALSISTCVPLTSMTALGAETGSAAEAAVHVDDASSEEAAETVEEAESSSEAAPAAIEKSDDADEVLPENSQEEAIPSEEVDTAGEAEESDAETVDANASEETESALPALEVESGAADNEGMPASSEETPESAAETPAEENSVIIAPAETETVREDAAGSIVANGNCGEHLTWTLNEGGVLTISGTGPMYYPTYDEEGEYADMPWSEHLEAIKSVYIRDGVTTISGEAFGNCQYLQEVSIPDTVTDIGEGAFSACGCLVGVILPDNLTVIRKSTFRNCASLTQITIPDRVKRIEEWAFYACLNLGMINLPDSVADIGAGAFFHTRWQSAMGDFPVYKGLLLRYQGQGPTVHIPAEVTRIGTFAFEDNEIVEKVILPEGVSRIEDFAFSWCFGLKEISIPSTVTYIGVGAFDECTNLESIIIPESVTEIKDQTFFGNTKLSSVQIPETVTKIADDAFEECSDLLVIKGMTGSYAQQYAKEHNITFIAMDSSAQIIDQGTCGENVTWTLDEEGTLNINGTGEMNDFPYSSAAPWYGHTVNKVVISEGISSIGDYAFYDLAMTSISFPESLESIGCFAFYGCNRLDAIHIPCNVTSIDRGAFSGSPYGISRLTSIFVDDNNNVYSEKDGVVYSKDGKSLIAYPVGRTGDFSVPKGVQVIGDSAFSGCKGLTGISFPESVTTIEDIAFARTGVTKVTIPDSVQSIGERVFINCDELNTAIIEAHLKSLSKKIFSGCLKLKSVYLPESIERIEKFAFFDCITLSDIFFAGSERTWSKVVIEKGQDNDTCIENVTIHFAKENEPIVLDRDQINIIVEDQIWTGKPITPGVVVKYLDSILTENVDYTLSYSDNNTVGKATVIVKGIGNYEGTVTKTFNITPSPIAGATISGVYDKTYTGFALTQNPTVKVGEKTLVSGTDYTLSYSNNTNAGTATATITGKGNYTGTQDVTFKINPASMSNTSVSGLTAKTYTGKALTHSALVKSGSITLKEGTDYTVSYKNNTNAGTATIIFTGKGNYTGTRTSSFVILKAAQNISIKVSTSSIAVGRTATVSITGNVGAKSYKSSLATVAAVNAAGTITAKKVGSTTITATAAATANYKAASKTVSIKVVPAATSSITAENLATGIRLTWKSVAGATGYKVYRGSALIKTVTGGSTVTCTDTTANANGTTYTFRVVPTAPTGAGLAKTLAVYRIARPAVSSVKNTASRKMTVRWGKNAKANGYQIQYSTNKKFASGNKTVNITKAATVSKVIGSLTKGKTYYVRIRTYKTVGNTKWWSAWSPAKTVKITK